MLINFRKVCILHIPAPDERWLLFVHNFPEQHQPLPIHEDCGGLSDCVRHVYRVNTPRRGLYIDRNIWVRQQHGP